MRCKNRFCIYHNHGECILEEVDLDGRGCCQEYRSLSLPEEGLRQAREKLATRYQKICQPWPEEKEEGVDGHRVVVYNIDDTDK